MQKVWVIDIYREGHLDLTLTKVIEAPKYLIERYTKWCLRFLGATRVRKEMPDTYFGYRKGERVSFCMARMHMHIVRDRSYIGEEVN